MTPERMASIPDNLLAQEGTSGLRSWLQARGLGITLLELEIERRRRGIPSPCRAPRPNARVRRSRQAPGGAPTTGTRKAGGPPQSPRPSLRSETNGPVRGAA